MKAANAPKKDTDKLYFVRVRDTISGKRIAVGNYWAKDGGHAIARARQQYAGFFSGLETNTLVTEVEEIQNSAVVANVIARSGEAGSGGAD